MLTCFLPMLLCASAMAADAYTMHPLGSTEAPYGYLQHLPPDHGAKGRKHPLVFFLHGLGELGDSAKDLPQVAKNGPFKHIVKQDAIAKMLAAQSAIVIGPQGLKSDKWWNTGKLMKTLEHVLKTQPVDPDRVYITGLSMGGGGTWALITAMPETVAAAVPVCPAAKAGNVTKITHLPIWAHHAIDDKTVKFPENTQTWYAALLSARQALPQGGVLAGYSRNDSAQIAICDGTTWSWTAGADLGGARNAATAKLLLTIYPDASHDAWSRTYSNPAVWTWLFAQKRIRR